MSAWDHLPAHLVPSDPLAVRGVVIEGSFRTCGGVPPSPETRLAPELPSAVLVRQTGELGFELYARAGAELAIPLTRERTAALIEQLARALLRMEPR